MFCSDGCSAFRSLASLLQQRHLRVRRIILTQREHRIVGRGPCAGETAKSDEGEETAGFHECSKTPFHSEIHGLDLPKVVIILPCLPSPSRVPFLPA